MTLPAAYQQLVQALDQLPAVGPRAAARLAQHLLNDGQGHTLLQALQQALNGVQRCQRCRLYSSELLCSCCTNPQRDTTALLVLAGVDEQQQAEQQGWQGQYFILHGLLSPMAGRGPAQLGLTQLRQRLLDESQLQHIVIALEDSAEGRATRQFIEALPELKGRQLLRDDWQSWQQQRQVQ